MLVNLKTIFLIIHFICVLCKDSDSDHGSEYRHYPALHGWLKLYYEPANWNTARTNCHNEGAFLASPWTHKFTSVLYDIMSVAKQADDQLVPVIFSGAQLSFPEGVFNDVEGIPTITKEPYNLTRNCIALYANGAMGEVDCEQHLPYVCYAQNMSAMVRLHCGENTPGYRLDNRTGNCYQLHDIAMTWENARIKCQEEGGDLAVINSEEEADFLKKMFAKYSSLYYTYDSSHVFVGFLDTGVGSWKTIYGETLEEAGYARWGKGEPDNFQADWPLQVRNQRQACGAMHRDGHYSDRWCMMQQAYICEKVAIRENDASPF